MTQERIIIESMFQIINDDGNDIPFLLNPAQADLDATMTGRDIVPKARQLGMSAYFLARYTAKCLSVRNTRAVVISHDATSTQRMLGRVHYYLDNLRGPKALIGVDSKNEITFPKTNSHIYIGTAGSRKFGRGDTITDLHCSEVAFWENPKDLTAGLFQAVPMNGEIAIESTGYGVGNYYHRQCMRAAEGKGRFKLHFYNWLWKPTYYIELTQEQEREIVNSLNVEWGEKDEKTGQTLLDMGLKPGHIAFRRMKLEELDYDLRLLKQEYPLTLDECFQSTGYSFFSIIPFTEAKDQWRHMREIDTNLYALADTYKHHPGRYAIGVDVSAGVRKDRSVIEVIDMWKWEQVAEWVADNWSPDLLAKKVIQLGHHYNDAFITVETNNHGAVTLMKIIEGFPKEGIKGYPTNLMYMNNKLGADTLLEYGFKTTQRTKPILIGGLRREFIEGFTIHSTLLKDELNTFIEGENGKLEATEGCFDDRVIAMAVALEGAKSSPYIFEREALERQQREYKDPFNIGNIIDDMRARYKRDQGEYPIPHQDDPDGNFPLLTQ